MFMIFYYYIYVIMIFSMSDAKKSKAKGKGASSQARVVGCFADDYFERDLPAKTEFTAGFKMYPKACIDKCLKMKRQYAGLQGKDCFCGHTFGKYGKSTNCKEKCQGDSKKICGGKLANIIIETGYKSEEDKCLLDAKDEMESCMQNAEFATLSKYTAKVLKAKHTGMIDNENCNTYKNTITKTTLCLDYYPELSSCCEADMKCSRSRRVYVQNIANTKKANDKFCKIIQPVIAIFKNELIKCNTTLNAKLKEIGKIHEGTMEEMQVFCKFSQIPRKIDAALRDATECMEKMSRKKHAMCDADTQCSELKTTLKNYILGTTKDLDERCDLKLLCKKETEEVHNTCGEEFLEEKEKLGDFKKLHSQDGKNKYCDNVAQLSKEVIKCFRNGTPDCCSESKPCDIFYKQESFKVTNYAGWLCDGIRKCRDVTEVRITDCFKDFQEKKDMVLRPPKVPQNSFCTHMNRRIKEFQTCFMQASETECFMGYSGSLILYRAKAEALLNAEASRMEECQKEDKICGRPAVKLCMNYRGMKLSDLEHVGNRCSAVIGLKECVLLMSHRCDRKKLEDLSIDVGNKDEIILKYLAQYDACA